VSGATGYVYDFENHLVSANGITYTYDGDGHRVSKTVNGTTTTYATTDINPTGNSQVVGESYSPRMNGGEYQHSYIYGLDAALELRQYLNGVGSILTQQMYFVHDGHGSERRGHRYLRLRRIWRADPSNRHHAQHDTLLR
jgi:YD repeat-containing protein